MKGVVINYLEDKGFGFIKDQNGDERFFHISNVIDKNEFLNNLTNYYYSDYKVYYRKKCHVLNFTSGQSDKGLVALNIMLTDQIFNDKSNQEIFEAIVTDIVKNVDSLTRIVSGIKKGMSPPPYATAGGHGTYRYGYPEVTRDLYISFRRIDDIGWGTIEVKDLVLKNNGRKNITDKLVENLKNHLIGKTIMVSSNVDNWMLQDNSILKM